MIAYCTKCGASINPEWGTLCDKCEGKPIDKTLPTDKEHCSG